MIYKQVLLHCFLLIGLMDAIGAATLRGVVRYQNSGRLPASGVSVGGLGASMANEVYTTSDGEFVLTFNNKKAGDLVKLRIGRTDGKGEAIEVVNEKELKRCRIASNSEEVFEIIVANPEELDMAMQRYYNILETASKRELDLQHQRIDSLLAQKGLDQAKIDALSAQRDSLQQAFESQSEKLEEYAIFIAKINMDNANSLVKEAVRILEEDHNINKALELLNSGRLEQLHEENQKTIEKLNENLALAREAEKKLIDAIDFKANLLLSKFKYSEAIQSYEQIIAIHKKNDFDSLNLVDWYAALGFAAYENGQYQLALASHLNCVSIYKQLGEEAYSDLVLMLNNVGLDHGALGQEDVALDYYKASLEIAKSAFDTISLEVGECYNVLSLANYSLGNYHQGIAYELAALHIWENLPEKDDDLILVSNSNLAVFYQELGLYKKALEYQLKVMDKAYELYELNDPIIGLLITNTAYSYSLIGDCFNSRRFIRKASQIKKSVLPENHLDLAIAHYLEGEIERSCGSFLEAIKKQEAALKILHISADSLHPMFGSVFLELGLNSLQLARYEEADSWIEKSIMIKRQHASSPIKLANAFYQKSKLYRALGDFEEAFQWKTKAIAAYEEELNPEHPRIIIGLSDLARLYQLTGKVAKAKKTHEKVMDIIRSVSDTNSLYVAHAYYCMAQTHQENNEVDEALILHTKALNIRREIWGYIDHLELALSYRELGYAHALNKNYQEALRLITESNELLKNSSLEDHPNAALNYWKLAIVNNAIGNQEKANENLEKAKQILDHSTISDDHPIYLAMQKTKLLLVPHAQIGW